MERLTKMDKLDLVNKEYLHSKIRTIEDFPKKGISFKDITPLLQDGESLELTSRLLALPFRGQQIDFVLGLESRGFLFGTNLAQDLHAGFVPVRKPDKLPSSTISVEYDLEYGKDSLEIHKDALFKGARVLIHDDLIATGGTVNAATKLVELLGAVVCGYSFVMEIESLSGRKVLDPEIQYHSLLVV